MVLTFEHGLRGTLESSLCNSFNERRSVKA